MGKKKDKKRAKKAEKKARKAAQQPQPAIAQPVSAPTAAPTPISPTTTPPAATAPRKRAPRPEDNREITIGGKKYTMALGFNDLCDGEVAGRGKWKEKVTILNIHFAPGQIRTARDAFAMSLERFHPEIPFAKRRSLLTWPTLLQVAIHIYPLFYPDNETSKDITTQ